MRFDKLIESMELVELRTYEYTQPPQAIIKDSDDNLGEFDLSEMDEILEKCDTLNLACNHVKKIRAFLQQEQNRYENMYPPIQAI